MIKSLLLNLFFFLSFLGLSQTKIRLKSPSKMQEDYQTVNISDTVFVKTWHSEDMGSWYGHSYALKTSIPDGQYEIYVNDTLRLSAFIKNLQKDSIWTKFYPNRNILSITPYHNDMIHGKCIEFYENGAKQKEINFSFGCPINEETTYYENGRIQDIGYYENCIFIKQIRYDKMGNMEFIFDPLTGKRRWLNYSSHECDSMRKADSLVLVNGLKGDPQSYSSTYGKYLKTSLLKANGVFKNGYLYNGIYFIYDCEGVLTRKCIFKNGKYFADGQIKD